MRLLAFLALALACAQPAPLHAQRKTAAPSPAAVDSEFTAFGAWLARLQEVQAPMQAQLAGFQARWQAGLASPDGRRAVAELRPLVAEMLASIDRNGEALAALSPIELRAIPLPAEIQPAAMLVTMRRLNDDLRTAIDQFNPMLDALARDDLAGVQRATGRLIGSMRVALEGRVLMTRANLAVVPRTHSAWTRSNVELQMFRTVVRTLAAWPQDSVSGTDRALAGDLREIAVELEDAARRGPALFAAERAQYRDARASDPNAAALIRRAETVGQAGQGVYPLAAELAAILNRAALRFDAGLVQIEALTALLTEMAPIRHRFERIASAEIEALGRTR